MAPVYTYIIYTKPTSKRITGLLGDIDLYTIHFLLAGGKLLVEEPYAGPDPIEWYSSILAEQGIHISNTKQQTYKHRTCIWLEVDPEQTPIDEFTSWKEVNDGTLDILAWRTVYYPCTAGTKTECVGMAVAAKDISFTEKRTPPIYLHTILEAIL
jgi:hypothetical protein